MNDKASKEIEDDDFVDEDSSYNFRQLMDALTANKDLIITVPSDQVDMLKAGLIMRKSKDNKIASRRNLIPSDEVLSFKIYSARDKETKEVIEGQHCVRVKLSARKSITVLEIEVPDNDF